MCNVDNNSCDYKTKKGFELFDRILLHLMMHKACYDNMKEAFIDDVLDMAKVPDETEHDNDNSNDNISHDAGVGHVDDDKGKCLFGKNVYTSELSIH